MRIIPLAVIALLLSATVVALETDRTSSDQPRKKVIAWGGIDWYSPAKVRDESSGSATFRILSVSGSVWPRSPKIKLLRSLSASSSSSRESAAI